MRTSEDIRAAIERQADRIGELNTEREETDAELEGARKAYATAIAHGSPEEETAAARDRARELVEELIGIDNAIPLVRAEIDAAEAELQETLAREAKDRAEVVLTESGEAARALAEYLAANVARDETLGALCEETTAALVASMEADRLAGIVTAGSPPRCLRAWQELQLASRTSADLRDTLPFMLAAVREATKAQPVEEPEGVEA